MQIRGPGRLARKEVAEFLIVKGADTDASVRNGETPLHWVARAASRKVVELLISEGAGIHAKDKRGRTPLSLVEQRGRKEIVELLRKHDAKECRLCRQGGRVQFFGLSENKNRASFICMLGLNTIEVFYRSCY